MRCVGSSIVVLLVSLGVLVDEVIFDAFASIVEVGFAVGFSLIVS